MSLVKFLRSSRSGSYLISHDSVFKVIGQNPGDLTPRVT